MKKASLKNETISTIHITRKYSIKIIQNLNENNSQINLLDHIRQNIRTQKQIQWTKAIEEKNIDLISYARSMQRIRESNLKLHRLNLLDKLKGEKKQQNQKQQLRIQPKIYRDTLNIQNDISFLGDDLDKSYSQPRNQRFAQRLSLHSVQHSPLQKDINEDGQTKINQYTIIKTLGKGSFGNVKQAKDRNGQKFAIKIINKKKLKRRMMGQLQGKAQTILEKEIAIMKKVDHPHVAKLYEVQNYVIENQQKEKIYLVIEYMKYGSLLSKKFFENWNEKNKKQNFKTLDKHSAKTLFTQFALGLDYLHNFAQIVHRDIKPDNLLINQDLELKIADFGVSDILEEDESVKGKAGTQAYHSPEMWLGSTKLGKSIDIWSSGITLYQMIYGNHPFLSYNMNELKQNVLTQEINLEQEEDKDLADLLSKMLVKNPVNRITIEEILVIEHPWLDIQTNRNKQEGPLQVDQEEVEQAITKLSLRFTIRTVSVLKTSLNKSRERLKKKQSMQLPEIMS